MTNKVLAVVLGSAVLVVVVVVWSVYEFLYPENRAGTSSTASDSAVVTLRPTVPVKAADSDTAGWALYTNPSFGITLRYPSTWRLLPRSDREDSLNLEFYTGATLFDPPPPEPERATIILNRWEAPPGSSLVDWLHSWLEDPGKRVHFQPCSLSPAALDCQHLGNEPYPLDGRRPDAYAYLRSRRFVYQLGFGQSDGFNLREGIGPQILTTLEFTDTPR